MASSSSSKRFAETGTATADGSAGSAGTGASAASAEPAAPASDVKSSKRPAHIAEMAFVPPPETPPHTLRSSLTIAEIAKSARVTAAVEFLCWSEYDILALEVDPTQSSRDRRYRITAQPMNSATTRTDTLATLVLNAGGWNGRCVAP